jgi:CRP/FNR family transcriptional regulator/CRP/FNR family cyclic AMP-dependent transcriptional regulator
MGDELQYLPAAPTKAATRGRLTTLQKAELIRTVELFSEASVEDLYRLAAIAQEVDFRAQEVLYHEDDIGDVFYIVVQGKIECASESKKIRVIAGPGETVGIHSVLTRESRYATARALEDTFAIAFAAEDLYSLLSCNTEIMASILKYYIKKTGIAP